MDFNYQPPFQITEEITNLIVEIGEYVGEISVLANMSKNPVLRRENRIKTIHSSLAIEHNSLSYHWNKSLMLLMANMYGDLHRRF